MMGQQPRNESLFYYFRLEDQIPENHLLRLIDRYVDLSFVRERLKSFYSPMGRPSIDPEVLLRSAEPFEKGGFGPTYTRGVAYLKADSGKEAAAEFEKVLSRSSIAPLSMLPALSYLQLGRAYALAGETEKARKAYQDFLALWKDADPDLPVLGEAKDEYAKLK